MVSAFTVMLYLGLNHIDRLGTFLGDAMRLLTPFLAGLVIAFVLSGVLRMFETRVLSGLARHKNPRVRKLLRPLALLCTYLLMLAGVAVLVTVVVPQLATSVMTLGRSIPAYLTQLQTLTENLIVSLNLNEAMWMQINDLMLSGVNYLVGLVPNLFKAVPQMIGVVASVGGGLFNGFISIIVSIYILAGKEGLLERLARLNRAFMPRRASERLSHAAGVAAKTFGNYVTGQLTDALIVGVVSVVGLSLLRFPYAMLIGVIMGITNVIPFFGPFIGAVPGFFITLMVDPVKALWYILFVLVIQQVDGNIIAPKIIGESVGLPPLWVLFAVTVGGALMGIVGMVLGTPLFAVLYILLGEATRAREARLTSSSE